MKRWKTGGLLRMKFLELNQREKIFMSFSMFLTMAILVILRSDFSANDDFYMMLIASGEYGTDSQYLIFINIVIGYFLKGLYMIAPSVNWYTLIQLCIVICSFWILTFYIVKRFEWTYACFFKCVMLVVFEIPFYTRLQFNKTAAIACITGYILIHLACAEKKKYVGICGVLMLIIGGLFREGVYKQVTLFAIGMGLWKLVDLCKVYGRSKVGRSFIKWIEAEKFYVIISAACFVIIYLLTFYNNYCYYNNSELREYKEYRSDIVAITDYKMADWDTYSLDYLEAGISKEEYILLNNYILADFDVFDSEKLEEVASIKQGFNKKDTFMNNLTNILKSTFFISGWNYYYLMVILIWFVLIVSSNRLGKIKVTIQFLLFIGCILFFSYIGRTREYIEIGTAFRHL